MKFVAKRNTAGNYDVLVNGVQVGEIIKSVQTEYRDVPGTMLRFAKGKQVTRFRVRLFRGKFENAPFYVSSDAHGSRSLASAKHEVASRLSGLTLKND